MVIYLCHFVIHITLPYLPFPDVLSVDYSALSRRNIWCELLCEIGVYPSEIERGLECSGE